MLRKALRLCGLLLLYHFPSFSQYCTPTPATGGIYINYLQFSTAYGLTGGTDQASTDLPAYDNRSATPIGTVQRGCSVSLNYNLYNPASTATSINFRVFVDWNGDGDFDDLGEIVNDYDYANLGATTSLGTGFGFTIPPYAVANPRMRFAVRQDGEKATPCGSYTGSVQDYTLAVPTNIAPTLHMAVNPIFNNLVETQTNNDGISIRQFIYSENPANPLVADGEPCESVGIAITGASGPNGQWQYKADNGNWTNIATVSNTNALVLSGGIQGSGFDTRIRFVPTATGTASITYKAWDRSFGANGQYVDASSGGDSTAFSTTSKTTSLTVLGAASAAADVKVFMPDYYSTNDAYSLSIASLTKSTGSMKQAERVAMNSYDGFGKDVAIDAVNQKVIWSGGTSGHDIFRSNMDGTSVTNILPGTSYTFVTGVAVSDTKLFFADQGNGIFSSNLDGTGVALITGGMGQANNIYETRDIEYANNKIWYINRSGSTEPFSIVKANPDGTGTTQIYIADTSNTYFMGLAVTSSNVYWTEVTDAYASSIKSMNINTGVVTTLCSETDQQYYDLFVDEANALIYFSATDAGAASSVYANGRIKTIPLTGGTSTNRLLLQNYPSSLAFYAPAVILPVTLTSIEAYKQPQQIVVSWKVAAEQEVDSYTVQKSINGLHFQDAGKVVAAGKKSYAWPDLAPVPGTNYYRISVMDKDGKTTLTNIVKVDWLKEGVPSVSVYPTMLSGSRQVQVAWQNAVPGDYTVKAINSIGQSASVAKFKIIGSSTQTVALPPSITAGTYWLQISNGTETWNKKIIVQ